MEGKRKERKRERERERERGGYDTVSTLKAIASH